MEFLPLFDAPRNHSRPNTIGHASADYIESQSILAKPSGFMAAYDYTLNPYIGCSFGCNYCYAAFFVRDQEKQDSWGYWVEAKENAIKKLRNMRKPPIGKSIYLGSVTDPYQPLEKKRELVKEILEFLIQYQPRLVIQTRGPLATRDIDLFKQFEHLQINMTVTTDCEETRKRFEPMCPSNTLRLNAITEINDAGIQTAITMTPLLPISAPDEFAQTLLATGVKRFVVQEFHPTTGKFVRGTREQALSLLSDLEWTHDKYQKCVEHFKATLPNLQEGQAGFAPI